MSDDRVMGTDDHTIVPTAAEIFGGDPLASVQLTFRPPLMELLERAGILTLQPGAHAEDLRDALERLKAEIPAARLDPTDRATLLKLVLDRLAAAKIPNARSLVRTVLGELMPAAGNGKKPETATASLTLRDDEPAKEPVDGAALLDETSRLIRRHVVLREAQADAIALWIAAAYAIDSLALMPILLVTAPTMRSGKTTLITLLGAIVRRALVTSNLTGAVLARAIAAYAPTLLADEADTWLTDEASELRGIMNAGHTRATAFVLRCAPETNEPMLIACFAARVLSMIRRPPATIADRSIAIDLRRKRADECVARLRVDRLHEEHAPVRRRWRRWADDHLEDLRELDPDVPAGLNDRAADNWRPLLAIADLAGGEWPSRARAAAGALTGQEDADESVALELLRDIRTLFEDRGGPWLATAALTAALVALPDSRWAEWSSGRPLTSVKLAARLRPFGLRPRKVRDGSRTVNAYLSEDFRDIFRRYLPINSEHPEQTNESGPRSDFFNSEQKANVPSQKTRNTPMFPGSVPDVPSCNPDLAGISPTEDDDALV